MPFQSFSPSRNALIVSAVVAHGTLETFCLAAAMIRRYSSRLGTGTAEGTSVMASFTLEPFGNRLSISVTTMVMSSLTSSVAVIALMLPIIKNDQAFFKCGIAVQEPSFLSPLRLNPEYRMFEQIPSTQSKSVGSTRTKARHPSPPHIPDVASWPFSPIITPMTLDTSQQPVSAGRITIDPEICHGKPVIRHLRYPVQNILEYLSAGDSFEDILAEFPDLEREDLLACLQFAAEILKVKSWQLVAA